MGKKKFKDKIRKELLNEPVMTQGWELKESQQETYLGIEISEKGVRDSITQSIKKRCRKTILHGSSPYSRTLLLDSMQPSST